MNLKMHFENFNYYLLRWFLFGGIGGLITPVIEQSNNFWTLKGYQVISGLISGFICAVIFTPIQNNLNTERSNLKTWLFAILIWTAFKFAAVYFIYVM